MSAAVLMVDPAIDSSRPSLSFAKTRLKERRISQRRSISCLTGFLFTDLLAEDGLYVSIVACTGAVTINSIGEPGTKV